MERVVDLFGVGEANSQKLLEGDNDLSDIQQCVYSGGVSDEKAWHELLYKAMELVRSRRPQALPNFGFISQLQQFEKSIQVHGEDSPDKKIVS